MSQKLQLSSCMGL